MKAIELALLMGEILTRAGKDAHLWHSGPDLMVTATADEDGPYIARLSTVTGTLEWLTPDQVTT